MVAARTGILVDSLEEDVYYYVAGPIIVLLDVVLCFRFRRRCDVVNEETVEALWRRCSISLGLRQDAAPEYLSKLVAPLVTKDAVGTFEGVHTQMLNVATWVFPLSLGHRSWSYSSR